MGVLKLKTSSNGLGPGENQLVYDYLCGLLRNDVIDQVGFELLIDSFKGLELPMVSVKRYEVVLVTTCLRRKVMEVIAERGIATLQKAVLCLEMLIRVRGPKNSDDLRLAQAKLLQFFL